MSLPFLYFVKGYLDVIALKINGKIMT